MDGVLEQIFHLTDHLGGGKVPGEHFAYRCAPLNGLADDLMVDRPLSIESGHLFWVAPVERLNPESDEFARSVERDLANLPTYDPRAKRD